MLRACEEARLVVQRGRDAFDGDVLVRRAAERTIEILVAAGNSIRAELTELDPDYPWQEMFGMRNRIVHEHWRADPDLIWEALTRDVHGGRGASGTPGRSTRTWMRSMWN
jgi:uncharacterized protein with HEPN domain